MNIKEIKEIIELMKENHLSEFEMERDGLRLSLKRGRLGEPEIDSIAQAPLAVAPAGSAAAHVQSLPTAAVETLPDNVTTIESPIVGTFYASPSPDAASYIVVGQEVEPNDVVCIIEAMKVMNEIKAEVRGRIKEILVKNGEAVEYGHPLFLVEKR